jgi:hypothetical protein
MPQDVSGLASSAAKKLVSPESLLLVFSEPDSSLSLEEYHSWYNDEHVALRTELDGFRSAIRLEAIDGNKPHWGAIYDIQTMDVYDSPEYKDLATNRSAREKDAISRLAPLDRRIYKRIGGVWQAHTNGDGHNGNIPVSSLSPAGVNSGGRPIIPTVFVIVSMTPKPEMEEEFHQWYNEEHIEMLSQVHGWVRSRRYELVEQSGTPEKPPKYLALHEYEDETGLKSSQWNAAVSTPWRNRVIDKVVARERRIFKVWRTFK